ncbi:PPE family protein [Mycobacterium saskatchewanense]
MDFTALPPEVNSGRMYAGAGAGPLMAAAAAWDGIAAEMSSAANSYQAVVLELTNGPWVGPSSLSMAAAAAPYAAWMDTTAAQAEQTANQARSAVAAYEAAFAATVPPAVVAQNRLLLATLVATNILGQNTPAIMATEAHYAEMWAQDAAAMYGYTVASAGTVQSIQSTPFSAAPQTTNGSGSSTQAAAATPAAGSTASQIVQTLGSGNGPLSWLTDLLNNPWITGYESLTSAGALAPYASLSDGVLFNACGVLFDIVPMTSAGMIPGVAAAQATVAAAAPADAAAAAASLAGSHSGDASAAIGRAGTVGGLSVPQSWASAAPEIRLVARGLPMAGLDALPQVVSLPGGGFGGMPGIGPIGSVVNAPRNGETRSRSQAKAGGQQPGAGGGHGETKVRWANFDEFPTDGKPMSEHEKLRKAIAEVAKERDVLTRSAAMLINEALQR